MPQEPTQQTGYTLDGFAESGPNPNVTLEVEDVKCVAAGFTFKTTEQAAAKPEEAGCFYNGQKVSDHRPVSCTVRVKVRSAEAEPPAKKARAA